MRDKPSHLKQVNQGYWEHFWFAQKWGLVLIGAGIASVIHGIFPPLFPFFAPRTVNRIARMIRSRNVPGEAEET